MDYIIHKDCFGYINNSDKGCAALSCLYCKFEKCKFYKKDREGKYPETVEGKKRFINFA